MAVRVSERGLTLRWALVALGLVFAACAAAVAVWRFAELMDVVQAMGELENPDTVDESSEGWGWLWLGLGFAVLATLSLVVSMMFGRSTKTAGSDDA